MFTAPCGVRQSLFITSEDNKRRTEFQSSVRKRKGSVYERLWKLALGSCIRGAGVAPYTEVCHIHHLDSRVSDLFCVSCVLVLLCVHRSHQQ